ncbi:SGNH/GDSL hydrolase family protein [Fulvivirgaceae bacterium PWU4]|uniref:SGNH/GDSL hydrolase family protein n=1 Tax=Chryseosolibacter histidini TaxID=2782349 RepID=A0AAP2DKW9_9BACT|nr:SGNH/GDSL hydrolase family protein [Chryseosolibacter histidini]MBT1696852.1 SGNH/GDSL hydrolase family protein [Chryseosolibacter histidini]
MAQTTGSQTNRKFLALGDSYTIGESVAEHERWPLQLAEALRKKGVAIAAPHIIATTGWRTDDLKRAILAANPAHDQGLVSLLIGVNNQYQGKSAVSYAPEFEELLNMAIAFAGNDKSKVFVVSIPDYGYTPFGKEKQESISKAIDEFNAVNRSITEKYGVQYFYITDISRKGFDDPALVAQDGLHPSGKMYAEWVKLIAQGLTFP